jgi:hypothetical protein
LTLAGVLMLGVAHFLATPVLSATAVAVRAAFEWVDDHFVVLDLGAVNDDGHGVIRMHADLARPTYVNGYRLMPMGARGWYEVSITSGGALQGPVVAFILLLAWPARSVGHMTKRLLVAAPIVAVFTVLDITATLLANLWIPLVREWNPAGFWPSLTWARLLDGGGRFALAFVLAALIVVTVRGEPRESVAG